MKTILYLVGASLIVLACSTTTSLSTPSEADVSRGKVKYPELTLTALNEGKQIFEQQCALCHKLKPVKGGEKKWNRIVPKMVIKVNKKTGKQTIDKADENKLLQYLITMSSEVKV